MKTASSATLAILATGQFLKIEFYTIITTDAQVYAFHTGDVGPLTIGGVTYKTGLIIERAQLSQKVGLEAQSCDLTITPQLDAPGGEPLFAGANFVSQIRAGYFRGANWLISKGFFNPIGASGNLDVSPGIVPWFGAVTSESQAGRFSVDVTIEEQTSLLDVMMPRSIVQAACVYTVYDLGCTLSAATFTVTGAITGGVSANSFASNLTQVDHYFDKGVLIFTSGVLSGLSFSVSISLHTSGGVQVVIPFPKAPSAADTFTIRPACGKRIVDCSNTSTSVGPAFNNLAHNRSAPFVPQPETLYDGGTNSTTVPTLGGQGGPGAGSQFGGKMAPGSYAA